MSMRATLSSIYIPLLTISTLTLQISLQGLAMANKDNQFVKMFPEGPDKFLVESPFPTPIKIDPSIEDLRSAYVSVFLEMALRATASVKTLQKALMNNCTQDF